MSVILYCQITRVYSRFPRVILWNKLSSATGIKLSSSGDLQDAASASAFGLFKHRSHSIERSTPFKRRNSFLRDLSCSSFKNMSKYRIVMVRHGESEWNQLNLFCGWFDAELSEKGKKEALAAGKALKDAGYTFDIAHTSMLKRAQDTLKAILKEIGQEELPVQKTWRLNERHYGGLTGMNKAETAAKYGEEQVQIWRRSFDVPPPPMEADHKYYETIVKDPRYAEEPKPEEFPKFESLKLTIERTLPYWNNTIIPQLKEGKKIIIAAHGNSLRGIVKHLDSLSNEQIMGLNLPTGIPFVYELDENFKPVVSMKFLGDEETVKAAIAAVAAQGKAK